MEVTLLFRKLNTVTEVKNAISSMPKENIKVFQKTVDLITFQPSLLLLVMPDNESMLANSYKYEVSLELLFDAGVELSFNTPFTVVV